jgi:hypothetical protein
LASYIPNEAGEFASDGHANFILWQMSTEAQASVPLREAQLGLPSDVPNDFGLALLARLEVPADACLMSVIPRCFYQNASSVDIAGLGNCTLAAALSR